MISTTAKRTHEARSAKYPYQRSRRGRLGVPFMAAVLLLAAGTHLQAWEVDLPKGDATRVVIDGSGDVIAAGALEPPASNSRSQVVKFDGGSGAELWRFLFEGTTPPPDTSLNAIAALAVDSAGDIFAGGKLYDALHAWPATDLAVIKLDGATGLPLWRTSIDGGDFSNFSEHANAIVVASNGDAIVAGQLCIPGGTICDFTVLRLDAATGNTVWRRDIHSGVTNGFDEAHDVALDSAGDVLAAGRFADASSPSEKDFAVLKLNGSTGSELWRFLVDGAMVANPDGAFTVVVDSQDNVLAGGLITELSASGESLVVKLDGVAGTEIWRTLGGASSQAQSLCLDNNDDVAVRIHSPLSTDVLKLDGVTGATLWSAVGVSADRFDSADDLLVAARTATFQVKIEKLDGPTGGVLWSTALPGPGSPGTGNSRAMAIDDSDDVVVAGLRFSSTLDFFVAKLNGADGTDHQGSANQPPVALCADTAVPADAEMCSAAVSVDSGSFDPDADSITLTQDPAGPYSLGDTLVTLTVEDEQGESDSCQATVTVFDDQAPTINCGSPATIVPPDAPISFQATATDNCAVAQVTLTSYDCFAFTKKGKRIDKKDGCEVSLNGDTITIAGTAGVGDNITWDVTATDPGGNDVNVTCAVVVVRPGS